MCARCPDTLWRDGDNAPREIRCLASLNLTHTNFLDRLKPSFGAGRPVSEVRPQPLSIYSIFGRPQLHRKPMRQRHGAVAVFIR